MIIHNATIHSPVERFATALHIEDGIIVWMGDEDTAQFRARAHPDAELLDAEGSLVAPSFHSAFATGTTTQALHSQGITAAHLRLEMIDALEEYASGVDATGIFSTCSSGAPSIHLLESGAGAEEMAAFLSSPRPATCEPGLTVATTADLSAFRALVATQPPRPGRIYLSAGVEVEVELLQGWSVVVIFDGEVNLSLADLARAGIPFAIAGTLTPWQAVTQALLDGPGPISARAGFTAFTRGAWRLTPGQSEPRGLLRVGGAADLAIWEVSALAVQAPDLGAAFWSTDQRAGTPLLPALGEGEPAPRLTHLCRRGEFVVQQ